MLPSHLAQFVRVAFAVQSSFPDLTFEVLEIGAVPVSNRPEPFHPLLDTFPGSRVHAFELDEKSFAVLEAHKRHDVTIHRAAIGARRERRTVHLTNLPVCTSLYHPNESLLRHFNFLDVSYLRSKETVETVALDDLLDEGLFSSIDFVKIDIQGAELDAFVGGRRTLGAALALLTEVEFVPMYEDQPLFGDVDRELRDQGFMFHKFIGMEGRTLRPVVFPGGPGDSSWHLWSDAMFVRDLSRWGDLDARSLAKLALLALVYGSPDVTYRCLKLCDERLGTDLVASLVEA